LDYGAIYNDDYYEGRGADPHIDYATALTNPTSATQRYEWRGILTRVASLTSLDQKTPWLDYGCGVGGLVRYLRAQGYGAVIGFEQGWSEKRLQDQGIPYLRDEELDARRGQFDVITAIEVLEHAIDPLAELRRMRTLLRPGGVLFLTTGNARPYRNKLSRWRYVMPEVHISFFEPRTLALALEITGFDPRYPGFGPGWTDMYRAKALRTVGRHTSSSLERVVPWVLLARAFDAKLQLAGQPIGVVVRSGESAT